MTENETNDNQRVGVLFKWGIVVGFILILLGSTFFKLSMNNVILNMFIICAGISVILGGFGSTATVTLQTQGIAFTGVAAISAGLFYLLLNQMDDKYVRVKIRGDVENYSQIELVGDRNYLGAYTENERSWDFVIFGKDIKQQSIYFYVTSEDDRELPYACIAKNKILPYLASGEIIEWSLQKEENDNFVLFDSENNISIAKLDNNCQKNRDSKKIATTFNFISIAFAEKTKLNTLQDQDNQMLLQQLESDIGYLRRNARSKLADKGIKIVEPLLVILSNQPSYRTKLGLIVALTEMMRENKPFRKEISKKIKDSDWKRLVDAVSDEDRTIRIYSSEFLYDLGDPKVIPFALDKFPLASENGRYNLILTIKGAISDATTEEKNKTFKRIVQFKSNNTPKINQFIDSVTTQ